VPSALAYIKAGTLRALAVTTATRSELLPGIPNVGEFVPGYEASAWFGIGVPKGTPIEIVDRLNKEINAGLTDPKITARLSEGGSALGGSPADFGKLIAEETEKWGKVKPRADRGLNADGGRPAARRAALNIIVAAPSCSRPGPEGCQRAGPL
jgi:tripartite-type tricarboxylate transporter receptor subunit TctC